MKKNSQTIKNIVIVTLLAVTVAAAYIDSRDPKPEWWQSMQAWLVYNFAKSESKPPTNIISQPQIKTIERTERVDTPVGALVITKYRGNECLYAKATTAHANYYGGLENLKKQLKNQYGAKCLFWE